MSKTDWFEAKPDNGGVLISDPKDPLGFVWQEPEQVREIIAKLEAALEALAAAEGGEGAK